LYSLGEPADIDESDPQHLRFDTKKAVEELYSTGVLTYCLTLDPQADAYVKRIFSVCGYLGLNARISLSVSNIYAVRLANNNGNCSGNFSTLSTMV
jgi:nitric oxide reductase activation protein